ncbi:MAG: hypothetical protein Q9186_005524 [Xanthomendoza sp. 1 TL-2023]
MAYPLRATMGLVEQQMVVVAKRTRTRKWQKRHPQEHEPALSCASDLAMVLTWNGWAMRDAQFE